MGAVSLAVAIAVISVPLAHRVFARNAASPHRANATSMVMVTNGSAADLDPASEELASSDLVARNLGETLIALSGSSISKFDPVLATSWNTSNHGTVYVFHLRRGVRFHTGRTMTSADVVYCLRRTVDAGLTNSYLLIRFMSHPDKQITAPDAYTVKFTLDRPSPFFLASLANEYVSLILDSHAIKAHVKGKDFGHAWAQTADIGTGPYRIQSWAHSQQVVLTSYASYWGGWKGPHFTRIIIRTVPENTTRRELLERGQADLTFQLTPPDYVAMSKESNLQVISKYGTEVDYVVMTQDGPLASRYARQALCYAFNYDALVNGIYRGYAKRAYGPITSNIYGFDPHAFLFPTDLNKAKALLQKAGVKQGTTLTYDYYPGTVSEGQGRILQAQLAQIGINVKLKLLDEATFNGIFYGTEPAKQRPNLMPFGWWPDYNDPYDYANILVSSTAAGAAGANAGYYHNNQVDALLTQMKNANPATLSDDARRLLQLTAKDDPAAIWTDEPAQVTVMARSIKGYVFNPLELQTYDFYSLHR
jgi:peptide/nickel transport system substrate-binding protein